MKGYVLVHVDWYEELPEVVTGWIEDRMAALLARAQERRLVTIEEAMVEAELSWSTVCRLARRGVVRAVKAQNEAGRLVWRVDPVGCRAWAMLGQSERRRVVRGEVGLGVASGLAVQPVPVGQARGERTRQMRVDGVQRVAYEVGEGWMPRGRAPAWVVVEDDELV